MEPVDVAELTVILELGPRQQVRTGAHRVVALEAVRAVGPDLAADEAVLVLLRVEIVQRPLEREETVAVAGEHHHETVVPHEDVPVIRHVQVRTDEAGAFLGLPDVADGDLPGVPVHLHFLFVAGPEGSRKNLFRLRERLGLDRLRFHRPVGILRHEDVLHVRVLVRKVVGAALEVLGPQNRHGSQQQGDYRDFSHLVTSRLMVRGISMLI